MSFILLGILNYQAAGGAGPAEGYFSAGNGSTTVYKWAFPSDSVSTTTAAPAAIIRNAGFASV